MSSVDRDKQALRARLGSAKTLNALIKITQDQLSRFGIDGFFLFELSCPADFIGAVGNLPKKLLEGVKANGFQCSDLVLHHLLADPRRLPAPLFRSAVDTHIRSAPCEPLVFRRHKEFTAYLESFDIADIFYFPFERPNARYPAVFCLWSNSNGAADFQSRVDRCADEIAPLAELFDEITRKQYCKEFRNMAGTRVPHAVRKVVEAHAQKDLPFTEVARLFGKHQVTVNKQVAAAKLAFGTYTTTGLVLEMVRQGQISVEGFG